MENLYTALNVNYSSQSEHTIAEFATNVHLEWTSKCIGEHKSALNANNNNVSHCVW